MSRDAAAAAIARCCELQQAIHRPLESGIPDLTSDEHDELMKRVGGVMAVVYADLMFPLIVRFKELDPDPPDPPPPSDPGPPIEDEPPPLAEFGRLLIAAAEQAAADLHHIVDAFERGSDREEGRSFREHAARSFQEITAVGDLGRRLLARST